MTDISMTKSELIERIVAAQARSSSAQLNSKDVEFAVKTMLEQGTPLEWGPWSEPFHNHFERHKDSGCRLH